MNLVRLARAFAFGAPLAFLVAAYISPPDPVMQLVFLAVGLPLFVGGAYLLVAESGNTRALVAFFGTILVTVLVGSLASNALGGGVGLRLVVVAIAVGVGALAVMRIG